MIGHLRTGKMNGLLIDSDKRSPLFPNIPTITEFGYKEPLTRYTSRSMRRPGMAKSQLVKIAADIREIVSEPAFLDRNLIQRGLEPVLDTPDEFAAFLKRDRATAKRIVEAAGLQAQ
jgi:tripartite-type tricarboxylate transporter receptor subunit TctC